MRLIEIIANDRLGRKGESFLYGIARESIADHSLPDSVRVKCSPEDTVGDLKKLIAAQTGTSPEKVSKGALRKCSWQLIKVWSAYL